jgi:alkylated DNA nucleotide flippase Atl1
MKLSDQLNLFSGEDLKKIGIAQVLQHTPLSWRMALEDHILALPKGRVFLIEDITAIIGQPPHPNSVGATTRAIAEMGWMKEVDQVKATRRSRHAAKVTRWIRL